MKVKELITELLELDMNIEIEASIKIKKNTNCLEISDEQFLEKYSLPSCDELEGKI